MNPTPSNDKAVILHRWVTGPSVCWGTYWNNLLSRLPVRVFKTLRIRLPMPPQSSTSPGSGCSTPDQANHRASKTLHCGSNSNEDKQEPFLQLQTLKLGRFEGEFTSHPEIIWQRSLGLHPGLGSVIALWTTGARFYPSYNQERVSKLSNLLRMARQRHKSERPLSLPQVRHSMLSASCTISTIFALVCSTYKHQCTAHHVSVV